MTRDFINAPPANTQPGVKRAQGTNVWAWWLPRHTSINSQDIQIKWHNKLVFFNNLADGLALLFSRAFVIFLVYNESGIFYYYITAVQVGDVFCWFKMISFQFANLSIYPESHNCIRVVPSKWCTCWILHVPFIWWSWNDLHIRNPGMQLQFCTFQ